ncbi:MAG: hypothetical protein AVDCRST_MAG88-1932, partial [uncultured Thermomicrobiales bacterium]
GERERPAGRTLSGATGHPVPGVLDRAGAGGERRLHHPTDPRPRGGRVHLAPDGGRRRRHRQAAGARANRILRPWTQGADVRQPRGQV